MLVIFISITIIYSTDNPLNKSAITVPQRALSTFDEQDPSINTRLLIGNTTFDMIKEKPILGSGIGTFRINYLNYQADFLKNNPYYIKYSVKASEAHNEYLQMWAELRIIGLGIFLSILFVFYNLILNYLKKGDKKIIVFGIVMGIVCFLIHSLFTFPLHIPALGSAFFIVVGLAVVYIEDIIFAFSNKNTRKIVLRNNKLLGILIIFILIIMIFLINSFVVKSYIAELFYYQGMNIA